MQGKEPSAGLVHTFCDEVGREELINRIQNLRKESGFEVTDKIRVEISHHEQVDAAVNTFGSYIGSQTLAEEVSLVDKLENDGSKQIDIDDDVLINIRVCKVL